MLFAYREFRPVIHETSYIAPTATIIGRVELGARVSVWFNAILRGDINSISVGNETNIQDGCILHVTNVHPVVLAERITVGHGVIVHGCTVESNCLIGMGSILLDGAIIGAGSIVAAGAIVSPEAKIPANSLVMGVPAKVVREVRDQDRERWGGGWKNYIQYAEAFRSGLEAISETGEY
jgi:carbonic anhydrase/acetyltransferase-like protein (isoleucine patch superfamily)